VKRSILMIAIMTALSVAAAPAIAGGRPLDAHLTAEAETTGGDVGASGSATVTLNQGQGEVCFSISTQGLTTPIVAGHIHAGGPGVNGPVVVNFDWPTTNGAGCVDADSDLIKDIRQNPGAYYVNVHNPTVPSGAVRGQLTK
jgi:Cu/Zn superoxide dismutase